MDLRTDTSALKLAGAACAALALSACGTTQSALGGGDEKYREAVGTYSNFAGDEGMDPIAAAAFWGTRYNKNQSDPIAAVKFSQALRKINSHDEALGVMQQASTASPENADVSLEYGKVLTEAERAFEAVRHLENAVAKKPDDWKAFSAYGVALDQMGEHEEARKKYDRALGLAPGAVSVLNNKGLSYALDGNLGQAKLTLRSAAANAGGDARIRQNLALVLALSGDMMGAERLARSDLPPKVADNNIDFYRQLMNQPAYWGQYVAGDVDTPDFDAAPAAPIKSAPLPELREEPKPVEEKEKEDGAPIALMEAAPVINASTPAEDAAEDESAEVGNP
ncbi:MAG: tetratricopeptide repeat protein [Pseudomonadota bacterium]